LIAVGCLLLYLPNGRVAWVAMSLLIVGFWLGLFADTIRIARRREPAIRWYQRWWFYLGYAIAISLVIDGVVRASRANWEEAFAIPTGSMHPTIMAGDRILVDKLRYRTTPIRHGDIIVFWIDNQDTYFGPGPAPPGRLCHVKRVVGLPGDTIEFRDERLVRNGSVIDEPYTELSSEQREIDPRLKNTPSTVVGKDELFVVGDNRRESLDSRIVGCIRREDVLGKVAIVYWSRELPKTDSASAFPYDKSTPAPASPRRIRTERFGLRPE
jgi:signal peptidase I